MAAIVQRTLKTCIPYVGTGLHSGCRIGMLVRPGEVNTGVRFVRNDVATGRGVIPALWHYVTDTRLGTIIGNELHFAALRINAVDVAAKLGRAPDDPQRSCSDRRAYP